MDVPARKGETIVAYCIAQCKGHDGKAAFDATRQAFAFSAQMGQTTIS
jgi:N-acetylglutamate synthase-like GNAT family acetyltransferase